MYINFLFQLEWSDLDISSWLECVLKRWLNVCELVEDSECTDITTVKFGSCNKLRVE